MINHGFDLSLITTEAWQEGCILPFNKPIDWSSFDVVNYIRKSIPVKKVGHAGTLDPKASGLLICCTGRATKKISLLQDSIKEYEAVVRFGVTSPSLDLGTDDSEMAEWNHIKAHRIQSLIDSDFLGEIEQLPPDYSALKVNGRRAYDLARKGEKPVLKPRIVSIESVEIVSFVNQMLHLRIRCGKGTYIRSIARDLGEKLGSVARLESLIRTATGSILIDQAWNPKQFRLQMQKLEFNEVKA